MEKLNVEGSKGVDIKSSSSSSKMGGREEEEEGGVLEEEGNYEEEDGEYSSDADMSEFKRNNNRHEFSDSEEEVDDGFKF